MEGSRVETWPFRCPERYLAVESREDCESLAATNEMPGVVVPIAWSGEDPNNQGSPSGCFKDLETGKAGMCETSPSLREILDRQVGRWIFLTEAV